MPFFNHHGIEFHYRSEGAGLPFFFQHGLGAEVGQPFGLLRPPAGIRLLAFDARGHGQTRPIGDPIKIGFNTFAEDLLGFMEHLHIERAIVGGISMGAGIALNFTLRFPDRVLALVLSRPAWLQAPNPWNVKIFSLIARLIREHGAKGGQELFRLTAEYKETLQQWPDVANSLALQFDSPQVEQTAFKFESIIKDTPHADPRQWNSIRVPTLVLVNRQDPIHPFEYGETLAQAIPRAELKELTSKSVSVPRHEADVQRFLGEFLQKHFPRDFNSVAQNIC